MMEASTTCTEQSDGGVCSRYATVPQMAPVQVGLPWLAAATLVAPSS